MVPAEPMVRAVSVPADTVPQADNLLHELVPRERFEIVVHRRHASSLGGSKHREQDLGYEQLMPGQIAEQRFRSRVGPVTADQSRKANWSPGERNHVD